MAKHSTGFAVSSLQVLYSWQSLRTEGFMTSAHEGKLKFEKGKGEAVSVLLVVLFWMNFL